MPDERSLSEQLLDNIDEIEEITSQITEKLVAGKRPDSNTQDILKSLMERFDEKYNDIIDLAKTIPEHQEREAEIRRLQKKVDDIDTVILKLASDLKEVETTLLEYSYQAQKKLRSIRQSETNRLFSEDVIRLSQQISKSYSVISPNDWQQGDPGRPFPTEVDFARSHLMAAQNSSNNNSNGEGSSLSNAAAQTSFSIRQPSIAGTGSLPIGSVLSRTGSNSGLRSSPMANTNNSSSKAFTVSPRSNGGMSSVSTSGTGTVDSPQNRQLNTGSINSNQSNAGSSHSISANSGRGMNAMWKVGGSVGKSLSSLSKSDIASLSNTITRSCVEGLLEEGNSSDTVGIVEQMTSDSSSSSSSGEEGNEK